MSDSNQDIKNEADTSEQEHNPASFAFDRNGNDALEYQDLSLDSESSDKHEKRKSAVSIKLSDGTRVEETLPNTEKSLRKKDSTGVRWVDWEGVAEISEKKVLDSPTDTSTYSDDRSRISCDYLASFSDKDIKAPPTLPLSVEQVKLDSLTEATIVTKQQEFEVDSDSDLVSPEGNDTLKAHVDIIQERYDQISKMRAKQRIEQENPFRPEGEVSKEANEIVDAIQSGTFKNIYTSPEGAQRRSNEPGLNPDSPEQELQKLVGGSVSECDIISGHGVVPDENSTIGKIVAKESIEPGKNYGSANATVEVHKSIIAPSQTQDVSVVVIPEKKSGCCVIL